MAVKCSDLDKSFGLKVTELLHAGTCEALPRDCSVCSRLNLLSLQTIYCTGHDTIDVCTYTVMRGSSANTTTLFILTVTASFVGYFFSEQNHLHWPLFAGQHPSSTQTSALRCQIQFGAISQSLQPPSIKWQRTSPGNAHLKRKEPESSSHAPTWLSSWV